MASIPINTLTKASKSAAHLDGQPLVRDAVFGAHGQLEEFVYEGVSAPSRRAEYGYDGLGRSSWLSLSPEGQVGAADYHADGFTYDERGFLTLFERSDHSVGQTAVGFGYDPQSRLSSFDWGGQSVSYGYDDGGNLTARSGALGVAPLSGVSYDTGNHRQGWLYDVRGRLLEDDSQRYEYDERGRIRLVRDRESGAWVAHYLYDTASHRARTLEPDEVTYTYRDVSGAVFAEEVRGSDHVTLEQREHVTFGGRQVHTRTVKADGAVVHQQQFTDRLGNPVYSWAGGKDEIHEYSPFGQTLAVGGSTPHEGAYGFTGHEDDGATGLAYMRARYYDRDAARFNRPDPARDVTAHLPSTFNLYQYVSNNPLAYVDGDGRSQKRVHVAHTRMVLELVGGFGHVATAHVVEANVRSDSFSWNFLRFNLANHATALFASDEAANRRGQRLAEKQLQKAIRLARQGKLKKGLLAVGRALHAAEDVVAHDGLGNVLKTLFGDGQRFAQHDRQDASLDVSETDDPRQGKVLGVNDLQISSEIVASLLRIVRTFHASLTDDQRKELKK